MSLVLFVYEGLKLRVLRRCLFRNNDFVDFVEHALGFVLVFIVDKFENLLLKYFVASSEALRLNGRAHTDAYGREEHQNLF